MIPDLSSESKPFLLHAGKQKRTHILSRQIFLPRREELEPKLVSLFSQIYYAESLMSEGIDKEGQ